MKNNDYIDELLCLIEDYANLYDYLKACSKQRRAELYREFAYHLHECGITESYEEIDELIDYMKRSFEDAQNYPKEERKRYFVRRMLEDFVS